jgi:hypothetical protein
MTRRRFILVAALALVGLAATHPAHASTTPALPVQPPAALYPAGTKIAVTDPLSNFQKSCLWNLNCSDGASPVTHSRDEDALGRLAGWLVFADWHGKHGQQMTFTLFGSSYATPAQAQAAAADYQAHLTGRRFGLTPFRCPRSVTSADGKRYCARFHDHSPIGGHYFSLAASQGTIEIELLSYANARYDDLRRFTFAQAQAAIGGS